VSAFKGVLAAMSILAAVFVIRRHTPRPSSKGSTPLVRRTFPPRSAIPERTCVLDTAKRPWSDI